MSSNSSDDTQSTTALQLLTSIGVAFGIFAAQMGLFELLRNKYSRIYRPKTYLVPERERTRDPGWAPLAWISSIFAYKDREVISKCGLDAFFFLRYLQTLLVIFIPLACIILPILLPLNYVGGRGTTFVDRETMTGVRYNVTQLDTLAWGNVSPYNTDRYWTHLILGVMVVLWVCTVFFFELRVYVRVRQDYLTSAEHRLSASATTILVSSIPKKWLTYEALNGLYDVFPGGIRNIWINRNYNKLSQKISDRYDVQKKLEAAETELIKKCKKAQKKQAEKDETKTAKGTRLKQLTKEEKKQRDREEDVAANQRAKTQGTSSGDPGEVPRTIEDAVGDAEMRPRETDPEAGDPDDAGDENRGNIGGIFKRGVGGLRTGIGRGLGVVGTQFEKAGHTIAGGMRVIGDLDEELESTPGYVPAKQPQSERPAAPGERRPPVPHKNTGYVERQPSQRGSAPDTVVTRHDRTVASNRSLHRNEKVFGQSPAMSSVAGNEMNNDTTYSEASLQQTPTHETARAGDVKLRTKEGTDNWLRFWKGPAVGYPSPNPHGYKEEEFPFGKTPSKVDGDTPSGTAGLLAKVKGIFLKGPEPEVDYPDAFNKDIVGDGPGEPLWQKYIKESDRPKHRLPRFDFLPGFLPTLPLISKGKVDTIYWCRKELARLNVEIRQDQEDKDDETKYPLMNSAFIQFNHQVAAHMACQAVTHHIPKQMAPRDVEIAPMDVIWNNMSIKWWESWLRTAVVFAVVAGMIILWAIPVAATALLGNLPSLIQRVPWLHFLNDNPVVRRALTSLAGLLPALGLSILFALVPVIFYALATLQGAKTTVQKELSVQNYYFFFLFVQIFLVVTFSSGVINTLSAFKNVTSVPQQLAENLPKASNYFFSYMILQAFSTSSGTLLQYVTLILWFVLPRLFDSTARQKWTRAVNMSEIQWGTYFPTYTNFACIALIYSVVSPLILIFAVITFSLYWMANRYCMLYIFKLHSDTGGLLYPRAISQTFTGLYVMELCQVGLFLIARDQNDHAVCIPQAIIMLVVAGGTVLFQVLLNDSFGPLFRHLPITLEDDAVLRDEEFERVELERIAREESADDRNNSAPQVDDHRSSMHPNDIEMARVSRTGSLEEVNTNDNQGHNFFDPRAGISHAKSWAVKGGYAITGATGADALRERHRKKLKDIEKQQAEFSGVFFSGNDELEDLSPHQRDALVKEAFRHQALREHQPAVWIPRDDLGVSDDEIARTREFSSHVWVSNNGAGLDSKVRVIFQQNPPDFSEVEHVRL